MTSPLRRSRFIEGEAESTAIVEDLLGSYNEWRSIPDIVRMSVKALTEVVRVQGATLKELERQVNSKVSKTEFAGAISQKANLVECNQSIHELSNALQDKVGLLDLQSMLEDKITRNELQYIVSSKVSVEEMRRALDLKANSRELEAELRAIQKSFSEFVSDFNKRSANFVHHSELFTIQRGVDSKVNEATELVTSFKAQLAEGLSRKANIADFDKLMATKADISEVRHFNDTLKSNASLDQLQHIEHELASKVDKAELIKAVSSQVSGLAAKSEVDSLHTNLLSYRRQTEQKLREQFSELEDFLKGLKNELENIHQSFNERLASKAELQAFEGFNVELIKKADFSYVESALTRLTQDVRKDFDKVLDRNQTLTEAESSRRIEEVTLLRNELNLVKEASKTDIEDVKKFLQALRSDKSEDFKLRSEVDRLYAQFRELKFATTEEITTSKNSLSKVVDSEIGEIRGALGNIQREVFKQLQSTQDELKAKFSHLEEASASASNLSARDLQVMLKSKADIDHIEEISRGLRQENREIKHYIDSRVGDFNNKSSLLEDKLLDLSAYVDRIKADSIHRQNFTELTRALEGKADTEDIRLAIREISDAMDLKSSATELRTFVQDQEIINEALCGENCLGRWIWKSGTLKSTQVPWEQQSVNTCPDNFLWDKDNTNIIALAPGLYEVMFGFYARRRPTIQLLVNGEPVLQRTGKTAKPGARPPTQTISGVTHIDFLTMPARATVGVSYSGEAAGEGFLCLRKL
mmetsp:Transcript_28599/g.50853  ORF Transcript_28599/g.50853 Transcript_28599/m.50853 type:complete len:756 (+) Transcript_28599:1026-3293(+)